MQGGAAEASEVSLSSSLTPPPFPTNLSVVELPPAPFPDPTVSTMDRAQSTSPPPSPLSPFYNSALLQVGKTLAGQLCKVLCVVAPTAQAL